jgi:hypothetical protein
MMRLGSGSWGSSGSPKYYTSLFLRACVLSSSHQPAPPSPLAVRRQDEGGRLASASSVLCLCSPSRATSASFVPCTCHTSRFSSSRNRGVGRGGAG